MCSHVCIGSLFITTEKPRHKVFRRFPPVEIDSKISNRQICYYRDSNFFDTIAGKSEVDDVTASTMLTGVLKTLDNELNFSH